MIQRYRMVEYDPISYATRISKAIAEDCEDGKWCKYSEVEELEQEVERLKKEIEQWKETVRVTDDYLGKIASDINKIKEQSNEINKALKGGGDE